MRILDRAKSKKLAAGIMVMAVSLCVTFSVFHIAHEADHDCTGEDCPICILIQQCENALNQIGGGSAAQPALILPAFIFIITLFFYACILRQSTLVENKVRLNN